MKKLIYLILISSLLFSKQVKSQAFPIKEYRPQPTPLQTVVQRGTLWTVQGVNLYSAAAITSGTTPASGSQGTVQAGTELTDVDVVITSDSSTPVVIQVIITYASVMTNSGNSYGLGTSNTGNDWRATVLAGQPMAIKIPKVHENGLITIFYRSAVASFTGTIAIRMSGVQYTADFNRQAKHTMIVDGTSIEFGTLSNTFGTFSGKDIYTNMLRDWFNLLGYDVAMDNKSLGGRNSYDSDIWMRSGFYWAFQYCDLYIYAHGINDASGGSALTGAQVTNFQKNVISKILWVRRRYPTAAIVIQGQTQPQNTTTQSNLALLRTAMKNAVADINNGNNTLTGNTTELVTDNGWSGAPDANVYYVDASVTYDTSGNPTTTQVIDATVNTNYAETGGVGIHPSAVANLALFNNTMKNFYRNKLSTIFK